MYGPLEIRAKGSRCLGVTRNECGVAPSNSHRSNSDALERHDRLWNIDIWLVSMPQSTWLPIPPSHNLPAHALYSTNSPIWRLIFQILGPIKHNKPTSQRTKNHLFIIQSHYPFLKSQLGRPKNFIILCLRSALMKWMPSTTRSHHFPEPFVIHLMHDLCTIFQWTMNISKNIFERSNDINKFCEG